MLWFEARQAILSCTYFEAKDNLCSSLVSFLSTRVSQVFSHSRVKLMDKYIYHHGIPDSESSDPASPSPRLNTTVWTTNTIK